jgi:hypothetical protein
MIMNWELFKPDIVEVRIDLWIYGLKCKNGIVTHTGIVSSTSANSGDAAGGNVDIQYGADCGDSAPLGEIVIFSAVASEGDAEFGAHVGGGAAGGGGVGVISGGALGGPPGAAVGGTIGAGIGAIVGVITGTVHETVADDEWSLNYVERWRICCKCDPMSKNGGSLFPTVEFLGEVPNNPSFWANNNDFTMKVKH